MTEQPARQHPLKTRRTVSAALLTLLMCLLPATSWAQDTMSFGEEEVEDDGSEESEEQSGGDDGTMSFGVDEAQEEGEGDAADTFTVAVVAIPNPNVSREQRIELQNAMREKVSLDPNYEAQDGAPVLNGLQQSGMGSCITEPLCLASVGREAGVERILMGRVTGSGRNMTLEVDLFDIEDKLYVKTTKVRRLSTFGQVKEAVDPAMKEIFDIRMERQGPNYGDETDTGTVQTILAYTAAGLSAASLGAGIYFGMQASDGEDALMSEQNDDGTYAITQAEANKRLREVESDALTANVFYGASAGLAVISGILFYVETGSDVGTGDQRRAGLLERINIQPSVGAGNVGLGASIDF